jgi:serine/threonine protein kinase
VRRAGVETTYLAHDTRLDRKVALKVVHATGDLQTQVQRMLVGEAKLAARLEHKRIARIYDIGEDDGCFFPAMEDLRGPTMREWMKTAHNPVEVCAILTQIAEDLSVLHESDVVHRDLKPESIMLARQGAKLLNFGLARYVVSHDVVGKQFADLRIEGTPAYMAPEQYWGISPDARADIFVFGIITVELVEGKRCCGGIGPNDSQMERKYWMPYAKWQRIQKRPRAAGCPLLEIGSSCRSCEGRPSKAIETHSF